MNKKINRMQLVLIIASLLIVFANISLFSSDLVENVAIKAIISILIPTILLVISYEVENVLKLKTSSKYITLMSMFSFFISLTGIYSEILNNITLVDDYIKVGGLFINPSMVVALFAIIIPIIGYFLNKDSFYKKIIVVSSLYFMLFGFNSIIHSLSFNILGMTNENWILEFVILSVIILLYNLFLNKEYSKTLAIVNLCYSFIVIYKVVMDYVSIVPSIAISLISIVAFLIRIRKEESKAYDALSFVGILIFLINIIDVYTEKLLVLPLGIIIVTDMLIVVADVVKDRKEGLAYKVILDVLTMILLAYAISTSYYIIPMVLVVLVSSLVSTYALKSDYAEQYILPFKTVLCIIGLLVEINTHIKLDYILIILIINVFTTLSAYFQKNEKFKRLFIVISVITLFDAFGVETPFEFIVLLSMIVFDYLIFFVADKRSKSFEKLYVILSILIILSRLSLFDNALLYLVAALIFVVGHVIMKDKFLSVVSLVACLFSTVYFISGINISYEVQDVLCPLILCGGVFYITSIVKEFDTPMLKALIIIILSVTLMYNSTLISLLVALAVNIIVLIVFIKNNNIIFKSSVVLTALCIINIMQELDEVPTFVYMLIIGLTVVFVIFKSIQKYMNEPEKEEERPKVIKTGKKYCVQCGNEISSRTKYCGKCGTKVNK